MKTNKTDKLTEEQEAIVKLLDLAIEKPEACKDIVTSMRTMFKSRSVGQLESCLPICSTITRLIGYNIDSIITADKKDI